MLELAGKSPEYLLSVIEEAKQALENARLENEQRFQAAKDNFVAACAASGIEPYTVFPKPVKPRALKLYKSADGMTWNGIGRKPQWLSNKLTGLSEDEQKAYLAAIKVKADAQEPLDIETPIAPSVGIDPETGAPF